MSHSHECVLGLGYNDVLTDKNIGREVQVDELCVCVCLCVGGERQLLRYNQKNRHKM